MNQKDLRMTPHELARLWQRSHEAAGAPEWLEAPAQNDLYTPRGQTAALREIRQLQRLAERQDRQEPEAAPWVEHRRDVIVAGDGDSILDVVGWLIVGFAATIALITAYAWHATGYDVDATRRTIATWGQAAREQTDGLALIPTPPAGGTPATEARTHPAPPEATGDPETVEAPPAADDAFVAWLAPGSSAAPPPATSAATTPRQAADVPTRQVVSPRTTTFDELAQASGMTTVALAALNPTLDPGNVPADTPVNVPQAAQFSPLRPESAPTTAPVPTIAPPPNPQPTDVPAPPDPAPQQPAVAGVSTADGETVVYTVQAGDTLYSIASRAGVTVDRLMAYNGLATSTIARGVQLTIPPEGWQPAPAQRVMESAQRVVAATAPEQQTTTQKVLSSVERAKAIAPTAVPAPTTAPAASVSSETTTESLIFGSGPNTGAVNDTNPYAATAECGVNVSCQ